MDKEGSLLERQNASSDVLLCQKRLADIFQDCYLRRRKSHLELNRQHSGHFALFQL